MDKYYTPDISEFFVGFECEIGVSYIWEKCIIEIDEIDLGDCSCNIVIAKSNSYNVNIFDNHLAYKYRVKYLDKEDIESLGFTFKQTNKIRDWYFIKGSYSDIPGSVGYKYWDIELIHDFNLHTLKISSRISNGDTETFFEGIINNKSELQKLMKQLNINNNG